MAKPEDTPTPPKATPNIPLTPVHTPSQAPCSGQGDTAGLAGMCLFLVTRISFVHTAPKRGYSMHGAEGGQTTC